MLVPILIGIGIGIVGWICIAQLIKSKKNKKENEVETLEDLYNLYNFRPVEKGLIIYVRSKKKHYILMDGDYIGSDLEDWERWKVHLKLDIFDNRSIAEISKIINFLGSNGEKLNDIPYLEFFEITDHNFIYRTTKALKPGDYIAIDIAGKVKEGDLILDTLGIIWEVIEEVGLTENSGKRFKLSRPVSNAFRFATEEDIYGCLTYSFINSRK